ncbi:putative integral membrane protein [Tricladium varicosporioides]|nr:putative integral membrane protein [Hymenoscyphus varicosporioides]
MSRPLSQHPLLLLAATAFGTIFIGFGINALIRPLHALTFFEYSEPLIPASGPALTLIESLMVVYGVRDLCMGLAMYPAAWYGERKSLGWMVLIASGMAFADGAVCWNMGKGAGAHWGYAPTLTVVGLLLLGAGDKK